MTKAELLTAVLNLELTPAGLQFIPFEADFFQYPAERIGHKGSVCHLARIASEGRLFKAADQDISCTYGKYGLGVSAPPKGLDAGEAYARCGLYDSYATAHAVMQSFQYCSHRVYGVAMGPVDQLVKPDLVLLFGTAEQCMRIMQGYAYHFGVPRNLCSVGNQAVCSDLISKVFSSNDINFSFMCRGARAQGRFDPGQMGIGIPYGKFDALVEGVCHTVNPVCNSQTKEQIRARLGSDEILGVPITDDSAYGIVLNRYDAYVAEQSGK